MYKYNDCSKAIKVRPTIKLGNYCLPDFTHAPADILTPENKAKWDLLWDQFKSSSAGSYVYDLWLSSTAIWVSIGMAPIYCFVFIAVMSAFAE